MSGLDITRGENKMRFCEKCNQEIRMVINVNLYQFTKNIEEISGYFVVNGVGKVIALCEDYDDADCLRDSNDDYFIIKK